MQVAHHLPAEHQGAERQMTINPRQTFNVSIYAYPQSGTWFAVSPSLVVVAEGSSDSEAEERFVGLATAYLETALERGWLDAVNRRPAFLRRLEIYIRFEIARLRRQHPTRHLRKLSAT
jgi:hypothetical protein